MKKKGIIIAVCAAASAVLGTIVWFFIHKHNECEE